MTAMNRSATKPSPTPSPSSRPPRWSAFVLDPLARIQAESRTFLASEAGQRVDRKVVAVLVTAAICLTLQRYVAMGDMILPLADLLDRLGLENAGRGFKHLLFADKNARLYRLSWWVLVCLLSYVVIPGCVLRFYLEERLSDYGLKLRGAFADGWVYLVLFAIAGPTIFLVSAEAGFQETYPFYHLEYGERLWPNFWIWEVLYFLQFFGVEFFFRGFLLHGTKHRFGAYAIFVMMVPYCMLHFLKPMPECVASILGAVVLGFMSLKTRSIWLGTAIHISVAAAMDFASLWRQGFFS